MVNYRIGDVGQTPRRRTGSLQACWAHDVEHFGASPAALRRGDVAIALETARCTYTATPPGDSAYAATNGRHRRVARRQTPKRASPQPSDSTGARGNAGKRPGGTAPGPISGKKIKKKGPGAKTKPEPRAYDGTGPTPLPLGYQPDGEQRRKLPFDTKKFAFRPTYRRPPRSPLPAAAFSTGGGGEHRRKLAFGTKKFAFRPTYRRPPRSPLPAAAFSTGGGGSPDLR